MDFDAEPTGVEVDTDACGKAYGAVPQEQHKVDGIRQQDPIIAPTGKPSAEPTNLRRSTRVTKIPSYKGKKYKVVLT